MSLVRIPVAPLEPKFKINKTLQINDLRRFSFVKNRHFWCKMKQFSVLFMDIFWIPQKCTLIASYFAIFQYLTAISTIQYPTICIPCSNWRKTMLLHSPTATPKIFLRSTADDNIFTHCFNTRTRKGSRFLFCLNALFFLKIYDYSKIFHIFMTNYCE